ncbi:hypothetical protein DQW50_14925 [Halorubrum sp. 48-1-W]|nr:hypothetical protein DQW50_14925 [Halorubrum sp. 48-1-W]
MMARGSRSLKDRLLENPSLASLYISIRRSSTATGRLWVIRSHFHEFTGYFEGERERVTLWS